jgi:hypothetical protein
MGGLYDYSADENNAQTIINARKGINDLQTYKANRLIGAARQQSIDANGNFDEGKFNQLISADPRMAIGVPDAMQSGATLQTSNIANTSGQLGVQNAYSKNLNTVIASVPQPKDPTDPMQTDAYHQQVFGAVNQAVQRGQIPQSMAEQWAGGVALQGVHGWDNVGKMAAIQSGSPDAMTAQIGTMATRNLGGTQQSVVENPVNQTVTSAGGNAATLNNTLSPSDEASGVSVVGANGVATRQPLSQFVTPTGQPKPGVAPPVTANPLATSAATAIGGSMATPVQYQAADGSQRQIPRATIMNSDGTFKHNVKDADGNQITDGSGALKITLSPQDMAQLNVAATNQADRAASLETAFEGSAQRKALIQDMMALNGDFRSGPGAAKWSGIVTEANRVFGTHFAEDQASSQQVFGKISEMLAAQQRDTLGLPATNAGASAAHLASPNTAYDPKANKEVLAQFAGNEDLLQRKESAWNAYHQKGGTYNGFVRQFNQIHDPRFFWDQYLDHDQQNAMKSGMSPDDLQKYDQNKARAMSLKF